jgi:hypothetical protein
MTQDQRIIALQSALDAAVRDRDLAKADLGLVSRLNEAVDEEKNRIIDDLNRQIKIVDLKLKHMANLIGKKAMLVTELEKQNAALRQSLELEGIRD